MSAPATETCPKCSGEGMWCDAANNCMRACSVCYGSGRVPVPMRDNTRDAADDESDQLRAKLRIATEALEKIHKHDHSGLCDAASGCAARMAVIAAIALEALKK